MKANILCVILEVALFASACADYSPDPGMGQPEFGRQSISIRDDSVTVCLPVKGNISSITEACLDYGRDGMSLNSRIMGGFIDSEICFSFIVDDAPGDFYYKLTISNKSQSVSSELLSFSIEDKFIRIPDKYFREFILATFDTDRDGKLSYKEGEEVRVFEWDASNCTSLKGIEHMPNLRYIRVVNGRIDSLDLNSNRHLEAVWVQDNGLKELLLDKCVFLETIACYNNQLEELKLGSCPNLKRLYCSNNSIKSINVDNCPYIELLDLDFNMISDLDISGLRKLGSIFCGLNPLRRMVFEDLENLNVIVMCRCMLDSLCIRNLPNLGCLDLGDTRASHFELKNTPNLGFLSIDDGNFSSFDFSPFPKLETVSCANNDFKILDFSSNPMLSALNCACNYKLEKVILRSGAEIKGITYGRNIEYIPAGTEIEFF